MYTRKDSGKLKARLLAQGFSQIEGVDYLETFAPVIRSESIKLLLALAARTKRVVHQMDVTTAFLNGYLNEEIYMRQAPSFELDNKVYKLVKSLYGLKQAPAAWNRVINQVLENDGFKRIRADLGQYIKGSIYVGLYVDDLLIAGETEQEINVIKNLLGKNFKMKDLKVPKKFVSMNLNKLKNGISVSM